jgi:hypothetical protein
MSIDPMTNEHPNYTPYAYVYNNPMRYVDLFGLDSLDAVAVKIAAENAVKHITTKYGSNAAYCNQGVNYAFEELTGNTELAGKNANDMVAQVEQSNNFTEINQNEVQLEANDGEIIIAGKKETTKSGHVALAVPGEEESSKNWGGSAPMGMDTGKDKRWSQNGMNHSWSSNNGVKFYKYIGTKSGTIDNKLYLGGILPAITITITNSKKTINAPITPIISNTNKQIILRK